MRVDVVDGGDGFGQALIILKPLMKLGGRLQ
jgi:hypothetical protein